MQKQCTARSLLCNSNYSITRKLITMNNNEFNAMILERSNYQIVSLLNKQLNDNSELNIYERLLLLSYFYALCAKQLIEEDKLDLFIDLIRENYLPYTSETLVLQDMHSIMDEILQKVDDATIYNVLSIILIRTALDNAIQHMFFETLKVLKSHDELNENVLKFIFDIEGINEDTIIEEYYPSIGSLALYTDKKAKYIGKITDKDLWAIAIFRLIVNGLDHIINIEEVEEYPIKRADYLFVNMIRHKENDSMLDQYIDQLSKATQNLKIDAKTIFIDTRPLDTDLIEYFLENNILEKAIVLRGSYFIEKIWIYIINWKKENDNSFQLINGLNFNDFDPNAGIGDDSAPRFIFNPELLLKAIQEKDEQYCRNISQELMEREHYDLNLDRLFLDWKYLKDNENYIPLSSLISPFKTEEFIEWENEYFVINKLPSDKYDYYVGDDFYVYDYTKLSHSITPSPIKQSVLVMSIANTFRAAYFKYNKGTYLVQSNHGAFVVNENLVYPPYLVHLLYSEEAQQQIDAFDFDEFTRLIGMPKDVLNIKIPALPTIEEQKAIIDAIREQTEIIKNAQKERDELRRR